MSKKLESYGYIVLLSVLAGMFVISPMIHNEKIATIFETSFFCIVLLSSVNSLKPKHWVKVLAFITAVIGCVLWLLSHLNDYVLFGTANFQLIASIFAIAFLAIVIGLILKDILTTKSVDANMLCGSVCVFLLIGVFFTLNYNVALLFDPNALKSSVSNLNFDAVADLHSEVLGIRYFSFVTLSTLGYGDIYPANSLTRTMAWLEAIIGQIYLTILVARLVGLYIAYETIELSTEIDKLELK